MYVHNYHPKTGEFLGTTKARMDPLEPGRPLVPAHATLTQPAFTAGPNEALVFKNGWWSLVPDHRGKKYWNSDGEPFEVTEINELVPEWGLLEEPVVEEPDVPLEQLNWEQLPFLQILVEELEKTNPGITNKVLARIYGPELPTP